MSYIVNMTVGELEAALLESYPASTAEPWDVTGLTVGDPSAEVHCVAIALDPTVAAIREAAKRGANVLLTHHPVFLDAPTSFKPADSPAIHNGAAVYEAIKLGIALMNFHTALDVSTDAQVMLPRKIGMTPSSVLDALPQNDNLGYGQICKTGDTEQLTLGELANRCTFSFGAGSQVWGNPDTVLKTVVTATGSASNLVQLCITQQVDCLVCGELKYHSCLDLSQAGTSIIVVGHDRSEIPLTEVLEQRLIKLHIPNFVMFQSDNWHVAN